MTRALDLTRDGIIAALAALRQPDAIDRAIAQMPAQARRALRSIVNEGARFFLAGGPERLCRSLWGYWFVLDRRHEAVTVAEMLDRAETKVRGCRSRGRAGHWTYDFNEHVAAKQARLALRYLRRFERSTVRPQLSMTQAEAEARGLA